MTLKAKLITGIIFLVIIVIAAVTFYRFQFYYPDLQIKVSSLYNERPNVVCMDEKYYRMNSGTVSDLNSGEILYQAGDKNAYMKVFDDLLWIMDNSTANNLTAVNASGEVVIRYSVSNDITDFLINGDQIFCISEKEILALLPISLK